MPRERDKLGRKRRRAPPHDDASGPTSPTAKDVQAPSDSGSEDDELELMAQKLIAASNKRRQARREAQERDLKKAAESLSEEIKKAYEEKRKEKKEILRGMLGELKGLLERKVEIENRIVSRIDALEKYSMHMSKEMATAIQGRRADLDSVVKEITKSEEE